MAVQQAQCALDRGNVIHPVDYEATTVPSTMYYKNQDKEGLRWFEQAHDPADGSVIPHVFNEIVILRNTCSGTLTAGQGLNVTFSDSAGTARATSTISQEPDATHRGGVDAVVCDHYVNAIQIGHLFRAVIKGHVDVTVHTASAVAVGDPIVPSSTAGKFQPADLSAAGTADLAYNVLAGAMMRALETKDATGGAAASGTVKCEVCFPRALYSN